MAMQIVGRERRKLRIRRRISGTPEQPRLTVFRSAKHIYAQVVDRSLDASQKIQLTMRLLRQPEDPTNPSLDGDFAKNAYDVYILGDLPAEFLTPDQKRLLARRVNEGSALIMVGGRGSFGSGGWANTEVGDILPTKIAPGDGQIEPPEGLKARPEF